MEDLIKIDTLLSDDERMTRDSVAQFIKAEVMPIITESFEQAHFPTQLISGLAKLGLLGMTLPEAYGGSNANPVAYGLVCQELERGDSGLRSFVSVQNSLVMFPIFHFGSDAQKQRWLKPMSRGEIIGCFGLTEPDAGSDPGSMRTTAQKVKDGWLLNGSKIWITNATLADIAIVWAKTPEGIRGFIVEKNFPGFHTKEIKHKLSLRASISGELILENCLVPEENRLANATRGLSDALQCLSEARFGIAWGAMGAAMACYDIALQYAKERKQFNKPIASFQLIQADLADMYTEINKTQLFNLQVGRLKEKKAAHFALISMAKMNGARAALDIARRARHILGANGISLEYHVIRHMNNLETVITYEGTDNIHHLIIGKHITGLDAF